MLIGIMSDSHDNLPMIRKAVDHFNRSSVGLVLHAGDLVSPFCAVELNKLSAKFAAVFGNNDGEKQGWLEKIKPWGEIHQPYFSSVVEGKNIYMTHSPDQIDEAVQSGKYDVVIYGHTHKPDIRFVSGVLIVNPGEVGAWLYGRSTVAVLKIPEMQIEIIDLLPVR